MSPTPPALKGELTMASVPTWLAQAELLAATGTVDLGQVSRADSSGVAFLLALKRRAIAAKCTLNFVNIPAQLNSLITFYEVDDALNTKVQ